MKAKKTQRNPKRKSEPAKLQRPCSSSYPRNAIRLVLQLEDTSANRLAIDRAHRAMLMAVSEVQGHGLVKKEYVFLSSFELAKPSNAPGERPPGKPRT